MSNITPLSNMDFSAAIAEITPFLENQLVEIPLNAPHSEVYFIMSETTELPVTNDILATLNLSMLHAVYIETQGGVEFYHRSQANSCIVLPLEITGSTIGAYSVPLGSARRPNLPQAYYKEDCTLIESHQSVDGPVFLGIEADGFELAFYLNIPSDKTFKAITIFLNENTIDPI